MTAAIARDPRTGLKPNLNLLSAYELYEKDYPVYYPDLTATLAMNSPLYKKIEAGLAEQTTMKLEIQSDATQTQRIASTAGVNMEALGRMLEALRPPPPSPAVDTLAAAAAQTAAAADARLQAAQSQLQDDQVQLRREREAANAVTQSLAQGVQSTFRQVSDWLVGASTRQAPIVYDMSSHTNVGAAVQQV